MQDEVTSGAKLAKGFEAKLFATFDERHKRREEANARKPAAAADALAAPAVAVAVAAPAPETPVTK